MAQGLSTPNPSLSPTHLSIRRGRTTTTHYTHHQVSLMVSHNTTLDPSVGLCIGPACEAGLSAGMQREHVPPQKRKTILQVFLGCPWHQTITPGNQDKPGNQTYKYSDLQKGKEVSIRHCTHHFSSFSAK